MNVYDFDETIYAGDSTRDFCLFLYRRHPQLLRYLPRQAVAFVRYVNGSIDKTAFKEAFYSMFAGVPHMEQAVADFWQSHLSRIKAFYKAQHQPDDLIISASPYFLLAPACEALGIQHLLASEVDASCGRHRSPNCYGAEKVARFLAAGYDPQEVDVFYSDSMSDTPVAELAKCCHIVCGEQIGPWEAPQKRGAARWFELFNDRARLRQAGLIVAALLLGAGALRRLIK